MERYSDEFINILVRKALKLEKKKKFNEAIEIYEELVIQNVEFAIERLPIAKHRADNYKLRSINYFSEFIIALAIGICIILISYNTALNAFQHLEIDSKFALNQINSTSDKHSQILNTHYNTLDDNAVINECEYMIVVDKNITRKKLTKRVSEAIEAYKGNSISGQKFYINIKTIINNELTLAGYIEYDSSKPEECIVFTKKSVL